MGSTFDVNCSLSVIVFVILYVDLLQQLFAGLFYGVVVNLHLFREVLFQPLILLHLVPDEQQRALPGNLNTGLTVLAVVEPGLRPPAYPSLVGIDADCPWDIEALHLDFKILQGIDDPAVRYGLVPGFFFNPSSHVDK